MPGDIYCPASSLFLQALSVSHEGCRAVACFILAPHLTVSPKCIDALLFLGIAFY